MKTRILLGIAATCAAGLGLSAVAAGPNDARVKELSDFIGNHGVSHVNATWGGDYQEYYVRSEISDDEHEANLKKLFECFAERDRLAPEKVGWRLEWANSLLSLKRYEEALAVYARILPDAKKLDNFGRGELNVGYAECLYATGKTPEAIAALETYVQTKENTARRGCLNWMGIAQDALRILRDGPMTIDELQLPRDTGAKAFPEPQQAKYTETFAPLGEVAIRVSGLADDDARVRLLVRKLTRFGAKPEVKGFWAALFSSAPYTIEIAVRGDAPVDKLEGYTLSIGDKVAKIDARDTQGALWGIVSFLQCVDQKACAVRQCEIVDWPVGRGRGYLCRCSWNHLEFALFNKMNSVDFQDDAWCSWNHITPFQELFLRTQAKDFRDFGLTFYCGIAGYTMYPHLPLCRERTFRKHLEICKFYASCGSHVYYPYDDSRFWGAHKAGKSGLHILDDQAFGTAAKSDAPYLTRLYRAVKEEYPDFKMIFCPPFYWGPDSGHSYPENREAYLKTLGESLDPEIEVYWTGPMVKGYDKSPEQVKWFTDLIGRKPSIFQNGTGAHNLICYGVDPTYWNLWQKDGFVESVASFHENTNSSHEGAQLGTLGDYLWNPKAYDPMRSIRASVGQLVGFAAYDALAPALADLAYFDKYKYGSPNIEVMHEKVEDLQAKLAHAKDAWAKARAVNPRLADRYLGGFARGLGWAENLVRSAKNPPDFLSKYKADLELLEKQAVADVGYDKAKGDILCTPVSMSGAEILTYPWQMPGGPAEKRLAKCLRGSMTQKGVIAGNYECDPFPPSGDYEFLVAVQEDERKDVNTLALEINGTQVWKGTSGLKPNGCGLLKITVPFKTMKRYNQFAFRNLTPGTNSNGTPWFMVNYIVIRKK